MRQRVTGIGGIFFKTRDPDQLKAWYAEHLGVPLDDDGYVSFRFRSVPANNVPDPVGKTLVLGRDAGSRPVLTWNDPGAAGYQVLRCSAVSAPCLPTLHGTTTRSSYTDTDVSPIAGELFFYRVRAVNECTAG